MTRALQELDRLQERPVAKGVRKLWRQDHPYAPWPRRIGDVHSCHHSDRTLTVQYGEKYAAYVNEFTRSASLAWLQRASLDDANAQHPSRWRETPRTMRYVSRQDGVTQREAELDLVSSRGCVEPGLLAKPWRARVRPGGAHRPCARFLP